MKLIEFSLRRRVTVSMVAVAVVLFGLVAFGRLPVNLLPDLSYPSLTVETRYPGAAPGEVEALITRPTEEVVGVVNGVQRLTSVSRPGLSQVTLEMGWGRNMDFAALDVRQKLELLTLPREADKPVLLRFDPANEPVVRLYLTGAADLYEARYLAEEVLKKDLESTEGVAAIKVHGGYEEEIQVQVDERKLSLVGLTIQQVNERLGRENVNQAGGSLYESEARYLVRAQNEFRDLDDIRDTILLSEAGRKVTLGDVAEVRRGHAQREVITRFGGSEAVELAVYKEGDANTVQVAKALQQRLENVREELPEGVSVVAGVDQSRFIRASIDEVLSNAVLGGLIAMVVLLLFLKRPGSALVIGISIPVSIVATFFLMYRTGTTLNIMSLGGLALGVGMLVDNAIVVLEAIVKRREAGRSAWDAAREGASEVGPAVIASTLTTVAVFLPVVFLEGIAAQLFRDQALTVSFSLIASLAVALTLIPMLALYLGSRPAAEAAATGEAAPVGRARRVGRFLGVTLLAGLLRGVRWTLRLAGRALAVLSRPVSRLFDASLDRLQGFYPVLLRRALRARAVVMLTATAALAGAAMLAPRLGLDLIPTFSQGEFSFRVELPEGTPLAVTDRFVAGVQQVLTDDQRVASFSSTAGGAGLALTRTGNEGENFAQIAVQMRAGASREDESAVIAALREQLAASDLARFEFERPSFFSFRTPIEVEVYGDELPALHAAAQGVYRQMTDVAGLADVKTTAELGNPELQVVFDRDRIARMGLDLAQVVGAVRGKVQGEVATRFTEQDREIDIRVRSVEAGQASVDDVRQLIVAQHGGRPLYLGSLAEVRLTEGPSEIRRIGQKRAALVTANLAGRDMGAVAADVRTALRGQDLPAGVTARLSGQEEEMQRSFRSLALAMALAVFLVYLVMASQFESFLHPFVIVFTLPLGAVGVVLALALTGTTINVVALIGAVMLAGIVVNNAIVLVDAVNRRRREGMDLEEALIEAGSSRLRPILMTSATTIFGLMPMALGLGAGAELRAPLAITVIGGLTVATALTLVVIPVVYSLLERRAFAPVAAAADGGAAPAPGELAPAAAVEPRP
ncbi:MAG TPA: efflux RND transporter permease subunit [Thermoanaerobaculia bacterium]|nr:efflux RND transporter permease subunit [Thermoanaerobaculia bacterium]